MPRIAATLLHGTLHCASRSIFASRSTGGSSRIIPGACDSSRTAARVRSTFAFALLENRARAVGERLLSNAINGALLDRAIDEALEGWYLTQMRTLDAPDSATDPHALPWRRLAEASIDERLRLLKQQRLLIRRAGPMVPPTLLWLPPPLALVPEDVPRPVRANARWFRVMKTRLETQSVQRLPQARHEQLARFLSRHAQAVFRRARRRRPLRTVIGELIDHCIATGEFPAVKSNPDRVS